MSYVEIGFCDKTEYDAGRQSRLLEGEVSENSLYTGLFTIKSLTPDLVTNLEQNREAFKLNARLLDKKRLNQLGLHTVRFAVLDLNLEAVGDAEMNLFDGFLTDPTSSQIVVGDTTGIEYVAKMGYFKTFEGASREENKVPDQIHVDDRVPVYV
jgi:hypothetical protein